MATDILTAAGEEYTVKNTLDAATVTVGLYLDSTDLLSDSSVDPATAITTEPGNTNYARQSVAVSAAETSANVWGVENDLAFSFDFTDTTASANVDAVFLLANFSSIEGDGGGVAADWIIGNAALTQTRDIHSVDSIDFAAGALELNLE